MYTLLLSFLQFLNQRSDYEFVTYQLPSSDFFFATAFLLKNGKKPTGIFYGYYQQLKLDKVKLMSDQRVLE